MSHPLIPGLTVRGVSVRRTALTGKPAQQGSKNTCLANVVLDETAAHAWRTRPANDSNGTKIGFRLALRWDKTCLTKRRRKFADLQVRAEYQKRCNKYI